MDPGKHFLDAVSHKTPMLRGVHKARHDVFCHFVNKLRSDGSHALMVFREMSLHQGVHVEKFLVFGLWWWLPFHPCCVGFCFELSDDSSAHVFVEFVGLFPTTQM